MNRDLNLEITLAMVASFQHLEKTCQNLQNIFTDNTIPLASLKETRNKQKELLDKIEGIIIKAEAVNCEISHPN
jgi:polysaccharide deacetylase 2 family uncharacterized protein YibQ